MLRFRRLANVYFLVLSMLMLLGTYVREVSEASLSPLKIRDALHGDHGSSSLPPLRRGPH